MRVKHKRMKKTPFICLFALLAKPGKYPIEIEIQNYSYDLLTDRTDVKNSQIEKRNSADFFFSFFIISTVVHSFETLCTFKKE